MSFGCFVSFNIGGGSVCCMMHLLGMTIFHDLELCEMHFGHKFAGQMELVMGLIISLHYRSKLITPSIILMLWS